jgi:hypothetical protein
MAAGGPTRALLQKIRVIDVSDENVSGYFLLLEMAFYAERRVAFIQQALVDGAVRGMADDTTLTHCLMLINKRPPLLCVTLEAGFVSGQESKAASSELLLNVCRGALSRYPFVRLMAIAAAHLAFRHRMVMRQLECRANLQVTLETSVRRLSRVDDRARSAASLDVQTPRSMARLATHVHGLLWSFAALCAALTYDYLFCLQSRVSGCPEIAHDLLVAGHAFF